MRTATFVGLKTSLLLCFVAWAGPDLSQDKLIDDVVLTKSHAYVLLPTETVSRAEVKDQWWSTDGRTLAYLRRSTFVDRSNVVQALAGLPMPSGKEPVEQLVLFSVASRRETVALSGSEDSLRIEDVTNLAGSDTFVVILDQFAEAKTTRSVLLVSPSQSVPTVLYTGSTNVMVDTSNLFRPVAVLDDASDPKQEVLRAFGPRGWSGPPVTLDDSTSSVGWSGDGRRFFLARLKPGTDRKHREVEYFDLNLSSGTIVPINGEPTTEPKLPPFDLDSQTTTASIMNGGVKVTCRISSLVARDVPANAPASSVVIGTDADECVLPLSLNAVAYRTHGVLLMRRMLQLPREALEKAYAEAVRNRARDRAKQAGLATLMYTNDYDDVWPDPQDYADKIYPYVKSRDILDGFVYVYGGGAMQDPSNTVIGYYPYPGGKAIVYGDGHVVLD